MQAHKYAYSVQGSLALPTLIDCFSQSEQSTVKVMLENWPVKGIEIVCGTENHRTVVRRPQIQEHCRIRALLAMFVTSLLFLWLVFKLVKLFQVT